MRLRESLLERVLSWLYTHPWGWLLVFAVLLLVTVAWLGAPLTWRNAEGDIVRDGQETASFWETVLGLFRLR